MPFLEQDLRNKLLQLSERHAFPIMLRVHAANQPFYPIQMKNLPAGPVDGTVSVSPDFQKPA
ncbi:MAG: hypothetical protein U0105_24615 [Candidatus Obscuribacterales bacterium]